MMPNSEMTPGRRMIEEKRIGSFVLPFELVEGRPTDVMALLATTLVIRCEMRSDMQAYEYSAYCSVFDPLSKHGWPPRYEVAVAVDSVSFVPKVPPGMVKHIPAGQLVQNAGGAAGMAKAFDGSAVIDAETKAETYEPVAGRLSPDVRRETVNGTFETRDSWRKPVDDRNGGRA